MPILRSFIWGLDEATTIPHLRRFRNCLAAGNRGTGFICANFDPLLRVFSRVASHLPLGISHVAGLPIHLVWHISFPDLQPERLAAAYPPARRPRWVCHRPHGIVTGYGCRNSAGGRDAGQRNALRAESRSKMEDRG